LEEGRRLKAERVEGGRGVSNGSVFDKIERKRMVSVTGRSGLGLKAKESEGDAGEEWGKRMLIVRHRDGNRGGRLQFSGKGGGCRSQCLR